MRRHPFLSSRTLLVTALSLAGLLLGAPRYAWSQG